MKSISTSLNDTLKDSDLKGLTSEWSEVFLDTFLAEGILKDIPIVNSIISIGKTGLKINEMMLMKKILYFISQINDIAQEEREKVISEIDDSKKYRIKIGEKLLYIIETCDDHEKAEITGKLFSVFLRGLIDYDEFLRCSLVIEKCMINDLKWFVKSITISYEMRNSAEFFNWGLLQFAPLDFKIEERRNGGKGYEITDKQLKLKLSSSGEFIRSYLKEYLENQFKSLKLTEMSLGDLNKYVSSFLKDLEKEKSRERLESHLIDVLCEVCNNYILNDVEVQNVFTNIMNKLGKNTIRQVTQSIENVSKKVSQDGNEFNLERWSKFSNNFIEEHDLRDFRGYRL
jgi:hypothetical protein